MERPPCFARIGWALNEAHRASRSPGADDHGEMSKLERWHFDCEQMSSSGLEEGDWQFRPAEFRRLNFWTKFRARLVQSGGLVPIFIDMWCLLTPWLVTILRGCLAELKLWDLSRIFWTGAGMVNESSLNFSFCSKLRIKLFNKITLNLFVHL